MKFIKQLSKGISDNGVAVSFIFKNKLGWFFVVPVVLNVLLFIGGLSFISGLSDYLQGEALGVSNLDNADFLGAEILSFLLTGFIWIALKVIFFFVFAYLGGYIVLILMSPILAYLSEKTEKILTGNDYPFDIQQLMRDVVRGVLIAIRNLFAQLLVVLVVLLVGLLPIIGQITTLLSPLLIVLVAAYFYGFSFTDYVNERQKLSVKASVNFMKINKGLITGNGLPFALILLIPFVGLLFSGFMAIISVVASVISVKDTIVDKTTDLVDQQIQSLNE